MKNNDSESSVILNDLLFGSTIPPNRVHACKVMLDNSSIDGINPDSLIGILSKNHQFQKDQIDETISMMVNVNNSVQERIRADRQETVQIMTKATDDDCDWIGQYPNYTDMELVAELKKLRNWNSIIKNIQKERVAKKIDQCINFLRDNIQKFKKEEDLDEPETLEQILKRRRVTPPAVI